MAKEKAIYAPGELERTRENLGDMDRNEAKRMAELLGGEVGVERKETPKPRPAPKAPPPGTSPTERGGAPRSGRAPRPSAPDGSSSGEERRAAPHRRAPPGKDEPGTPIKRGYWERVAMDKYAGEPFFGIKSPWQILQSRLAVFWEPPDKVAPGFVKGKLEDCYKQIEGLVSSARTLLPRNNSRRAKQFERLSPFAFRILNTIRYWDIEKISSEMTRIQAHPRSVTVGDLAEILRAVYRPIFILEKLDMETHIKEAYKLLYRVLFMEAPVEARDKYEERIRVSLKSLVVIRRNIRFLLYPLLLKTLSDQMFPYGQLFTERKNRFMAFIGAQEEDQILPHQADFLQVEQRQAEEEDAKAGDAETAVSKTAEEKAFLAAEKRAVERGIGTLDRLFPQAGWKALRSFPDLYPYFSDVFDLRKNYELIPPSDPLQQVMILLRILEELFLGLRAVNFGTLVEANGNSEPIDETITNLLERWNRCVEFSIEKEYLPRLVDYCRMLDLSHESRNSSYTKRLLNELQWIRRLYLFPYYKFYSFAPPPRKRSEIAPLYPEIRRLRKYLTAVAAGIEAGNKKGGAEADAPCNGINNPWAPYVFQLANPLSRRLNALLENPKQRTNASLVFFTLAVTTVLDHIVNNEHSWAYETMTDLLFRSVDGEGIVPLYSVETKVNTTAIFKAQLKQQRSEGGGIPPGPLRGSEG